MGFEDNTRGHSSVGVLGTAFRVLTFRARKEEFRSLDRRHLAFGLICVWVVGMGRYWDDPRAALLQHLGAGSVIYVFILALLLWLVGKPLAEKPWTYNHVLIFVTLTAAPGIIYAIPVERFLSLDFANLANALFLAIVAAWRVLLWFQFLSRYAMLRMFSRVIVTFLPLTGIVAVLAVLNLEHAVFDIMSGIRKEGTAHDEAYAIVVILALYSLMLIIPLLLLYIWAIVNEYRKSIPLAIPLSSMEPHEIHTQKPSNEHRHGQDET